MGRKKQAPAPARKIVVEALVPAPVEVVWERTQDPAQHLLWDIRFTHIQYEDERDERGFAAMDYRTRIGFGVEIRGFGKYLQSIPMRLSSFEFDSSDWKSLIRDGRGIWQYEPRDGGRGTYFKTVYDYAPRYGWLGRLLDALVVRALFRLATEWGFETLRRWCAGDTSAPRSRRSRWKFLGFLLARAAGRSGRPGQARSWLGTGRESFLAADPG